LPELLLESMRIIVRTQKDAVKLQAASTSDQLKGAAEGLVSGKKGGRKPSLRILFSSALAASLSLAREW